MRPDRCAFHGIMDRWQAQEQRRLDRASNNPAECHKLRDIRATGFAMRLRLLPVIILCAMANATSGPATSAACSDGMYCGRNLQLCGAHALSDEKHPALPYLQGNAYQSRRTKVSRKQHYRLLRGSLTSMTMVWRFLALLRVAYRFTRMDHICMFVAHLHVITQGEGPKNAIWCFSVSTGVTPKADD